MDYWGVDRSRVSLRLRALEKIAAAEATKLHGDIAKLVNVLKPDTPGSPRALYPKELEVLLALASATPAIVDGPHREDVDLQSLESLLSFYFLHSLDLALVSAPGLRRVRGYTPWHTTTKRLTEALVALQAPVQVFKQFMDRAESLRNQQDNERFLVWAFALEGFLDGIASSPVRNADVGKACFQWIQHTLTPEFLSQLHTRLVDIENQLAGRGTSGADSDPEGSGLNQSDPSAPNNQSGLSEASQAEPRSVALQFLERLPDESPGYPGPAQFTLLGAQFCARLGLFAGGVPTAEQLDELLLGEPIKSAPASRVASVATVFASVYDLPIAGGPAAPNGSALQPAPELKPDFELLRELASYSANALRQLEEGHMFQSYLSPHLLPYGARAGWYFYLVLAIAVAEDQVDATEAFAMALAATDADQLDYVDDEIFHPLRLALVCCRKDPQRLAFLNKALPSYFGALTPKAAYVAAQLFARAVHQLPQSWLVSAVYTLVNTLNPDEYNLRLRQSDRQGVDGYVAFRNFIASVFAGVVGLVVAYDDMQVRVLALSVISQKYGTVVPAADAEVLHAVATLAPHLPERDVETALYLIDRAEKDARRSNSETLTRAVIDARTTIAKNLVPYSQLHTSYLVYLLSLIVATGDVPGSKADASGRQAERADRRDSRDGRADRQAGPAAQVTELFAPLAAMMPEQDQPPLEVKDWAVIAKFRDAWFNLVVLGFSHQSNWTPEQRQQLKRIARSTPPLVSETSANQAESDLELNVVLRRGSSRASLGHHHKLLGHMFKSDNRRSFPKTMFLAATVMLEWFREKAGSVGRALLYFGDPELRDGETYSAIKVLALKCVDEYTSDVKLGRGGPEFSLEAAAQQLKYILVLCCHRVEAIRTAALELANVFIKALPAALCQQTSLYALLDLLTLMWESCVDAEEDEYEPRTTFSAPKSGVTIELSDSYVVRKHVLGKLLAAARDWSALLMQEMAPDTKAILAMYLEDADTDADVPDVGSVALGRSFALEMGGAVVGADLSTVNGKRPFANGVSGFLAQYLSLAEYEAAASLNSDDLHVVELELQFEHWVTLPNPRPDSLSARELRRLYARAAPVRTHCNSVSLEFAKMAVHIPFRFFSGPIVATGISFWLWIINKTPQLRLPVMQAVAEHWSRSIARKIGLFSRKNDIVDPLCAKMEYAPTNKKQIDHSISSLTQQYAPHVVLIEFLTSIMNSSVFLDPQFMHVIGRIVSDAMYGLVHYASLHSLARTARLELVLLALEFLALYSYPGHEKANRLRGLITEAALAWYLQPVQWAFGGNLITQRKDIKLLRAVLARLPELRRGSANEVSTLELFVKEELTRLQVWCDPLGTTKAGSEKLVVTARQVEQVWAVNPELAVYLLERHHDESAARKLQQLVGANPLAVYRVPSALRTFLATGTNRSQMATLYWAQVSEIESINFFDPEYTAQTRHSNTFVLQYAMRSLETHPVEDCFFYVPQIVQCLRHDVSGYVEEYILEAAKFSQKFAHQIIWNILANSYRDDDATVPDPMKPTLDRVLQRMRDSFSSEEREYYEREFGFFNEVTDISGKLKPYIKKSKAEKKDKIDEEMAKINVPDDVYLPSNPDGVVVDIDRESGKPLQSHAKAPFLAKFKIRRKESETGEPEKGKDVEVWQGAIFKVGDDCRQDVLALQIISVFRSIFNYSGLDLFVFPYRVTATSPGCGVIDVLPNSISRDMLGREAVNGLYEWFISKHGGEDSIAFQRARNNFVKSLAAYSVISYLIQFKDRHNGNIMYDDDGHIIHIDFGFCFEIVPGGVRFEAAPFKLTKEMVAVMGGSPRTQAYHWFEELCVKAFLASRVYADPICELVQPMLESGLPCFKGETIKKLRGRFVLDKSEREAAHYMRNLIHKSYESSFTKGYDEFQRLTNGIPY